MKVRLSGNSIRFRLRQSEVLHLASGEEVEQVTYFSKDAASQLCFTLSVSPDSEFHLYFDQSKIVVQVPVVIVAGLATTAQVGIEQLLGTGKEQLVSILIEKDFKCLDQSVVNDEDAYPNPNLQCDL